MVACGGVEKDVERGISMGLGLVYGVITAHTATMRAARVLLAADSCVRARIIPTQQQVSQSVGAVQARHHNPRRRPHRPCTAPAAAPAAPVSVWPPPPHRGGGPPPMTSTARTHRKKECIEAGGPVSSSAGHACTRMKTECDRSKTLWESIEPHPSTPGARVRRGSQVKGALCGQRCVVSQTRAFNPSGGTDPQAPPPQSVFDNRRSPARIQLPTPLAWTRRAGELASC